MLLDIDFPSFSLLLPPTSTELFPTCLKMVGTVSEWQPGKFVPSRDVVVGTLREVKIDPEAVESHGSHELGWFLGDEHSGLWGTVVEAFTKAHKKTIFPLVQQEPESGHWGLTPCGVQLLKPGSTENATALFLNNRIQKTGGLKGQFMRLVRSALSKNLSMSAAYGLIEEHIQTAFTAFIKRDSLRDRIFSGIPISDCRIVGFIVNSAYNDCRNSGTNPVARALVGARTERERGRTVNTYLPVDTKIAWYTTGTEGPQEFPDFEIVAPTPVQNTEKTEIYSLWDQLEKMIQTRAPSNWETYLSVIKKRAAGMPLVEIAATEEKSLPRITAICAITKVYIREVEETFQQDNETHDFFNTFLAS